MATFKTSELWKKKAGSHWDLSEDDKFTSLSYKKLTDKSEAGPFVEMTDDMNSANWYIQIIFAIILLWVTVAVFHSTLLRQSVETIKATASTGKLSADSIDEKGNNSATKGTKTSNPSPKRKLLSIRKNSAAREGKRVRCNEQNADPVPVSRTVPPTETQENVCESVKESPPLVAESPIFLNEQMQEKTNCSNAVVRTIPEGPSEMKAARICQPNVNNEIAVPVSCPIRQEAQEVARRISLTRESFASFGLPRDLADEYAVKRHLSDLSSTTQMQQEYMRQYVEERRHQEKTAAMYYDPNWLDKISIACEKCWTAELRSASFALSISAVVEIYLRSRNMDEFGRVLLDCACGQPAQTHFFSLSSLMPTPIYEYVYWYIPESVVLSAQYIAEPVRFILCFWPFAVLQMISTLLSVIGLKLPRALNVVLLLIWFLRSEAAALGRDVLWKFACFHAIPQAGLVCLHGFMVWAQRQKTISLIEKTGHDSQHKVLQDGLLKFDRIRMWHTLLPFLLLLLRCFLSFCLWERGLNVPEL